MRVVKLRPHHFNFIVAVWYPRYGKNGILQFLEKYCNLEYSEFFRKLAEDLKTDNELYIELVPSLDDACEICRRTAKKYRPVKCDSPDSLYFSGKKYKLFKDMDLNYGKKYPAKLIIQKIDEWVEKNPNWPLFSIV